MVEGCLARALHWVEEGEQDSNCQGEEDSFRRLSSHHCSSWAPPLWALLVVSLEVEVNSEVLIHSCICTYSVPSTYSVPICSLTNISVMVKLTPILRPNILIM